MPLDYQGELWLEISPRSFSVRVKMGSKLSQVRFRSRNSKQQGRHTFTLDDAEIRKRHLVCALVDGPLDLREGVVLRVDLGGLGEFVVGYQAIKNSDVIDVNRLRGYAIEDFWEPIRAREDRRLILDPDQFYILASRESVQIPPDLAAEMAPIDPAIGEFRVHYAGFFDPGFGQGGDGRPSARAVLEVRSRDVPFLLEDGQPVGRSGVRKTRWPPGCALRRGRDLQLSAPGPQVVEALPRLAAGQAHATGPFVTVLSQDVTFRLARGRLFLYEVGVARRREAPRREFFWLGVVARRVDFKPTSRQWPTHSSSFSRCAPRVPRSFGRRGARP